MGYELVSDSLSSQGSESNKGSAPLSYTEQFYQHLPFYLSIGMTYDQYWNEDCCLVKYYRKAYELKRERENQNLWLQGMYIYEALCDVAPVLQAFAKKGTKPTRYAEQPYAITKAEVERREVEKEKARSERMKAQMSAFAIKFNAKMNKRKEVDENVGERNGNSGD